MRLQLIAALAVLVAPAIARAGAGPSDVDPAPTPGAPVVVPVVVGPAAEPPPRSSGGSPGSVDATPDADLRDVISDPQPSERDADAGEPTTGAVRGGAYVDSDKTAVLRTLGTVAQTWGHWLLTGSFVVDSVTSASVDVRSSPALSKVDVISTASGRSSTSGGQMTDTRYQVTAGGGWTDTAGTAVNVTSAVATERDYASISGGINGSRDVLDRTVTLLGGVTLTDNWVSSVLDTTLHHKMLSTAWSAGVARVMTRDDALRLRYDGKFNDGYMASPYRSVRFGDWSARIGDQQITFTNTIGDAGGLPEKLPGTRVSHAAVLEWVHSLALGVGLHPNLRVAHDSWGLDSLTAAIDLRVARPTWRLQLGYRYYAQSGASFAQSKYTMDPSNYTYYTSDKELGDQSGHAVRFDVSWVLMDADDANDRKLMLNLQLDGAYYRYPGFLLLPSRESAFGMLGLTWER